MERLGELAAFGTALCWTTSAIFFEGAVRAAGALAVNFWKSVAAFFLLGAASLALRGMPLPMDAAPRQWFFLSISGFVGFIVADYYLFTAYASIGSRITVLFQALTPVFTAGLAFLALGERMRRGAVLGMALVLCGILVVVLSRARADSASRGSGNQASFQAKGYVFAFLAALFQAVGLVFSKIGLGGYDAISGTQIRIMTAAAGFGLQALITGKVGALSGALRNRLVVRNTAIGAVFGPFLGVSASLFALQNASAGAASTLMALTPVLIIPPSIILLKQRVRPAEILGSAIAVAGAALFFLL